MALAAPRNYLNNRDLLKEIHLSKNTYCYYADRARDHQYDIILPSVSKINRNTIAQARRNRIDRIRRETGEELAEKKVPHTDLVFRIMTWDHIPMAPKKTTKAQAKKKSVEELFGWEELPEEDPLAEIVEVVAEEEHVLAPIAEMFGDREPRQRDACACARRFIHLAVHESALRTVAAALLVHA